MPLAKSVGVDKAHERDPANAARCDSMLIFTWEITSERRMATLMAVRLQGIRSTHCAREGPGSNGSPKYWVSRATFPSRNSMMLTV